MRRDVPHEIIPSHTLPAPTYRDLPEAPSWRRLLGLASSFCGPSSPTNFGFVVFWACMVGVTTQCFLNMEIERWTLATGETAVTGFCRLWKPKLFETAP